eukprot:c26671_g1_i1 orf=364-2166(-)
MVGTPSFKTPSLSSLLFFFFFLFLLVERIFAMNSGKRTDNAQRAAVPLRNYEFDFGLGSKSKAQSGMSLNAQKHTSSHPAAAAYQPQQSASWAAQAQPASFSWNAPSSMPSRGFSSPAAAQIPISSRSASGLDSRGVSMVGDISGKSWAASDASRLGDSGFVGGVTGKAKAEMFKDLLGVALGSSSVIKPSQQPSIESKLSVGNVAPSLPNQMPMNQAKAAQAKSSSTSEMGEFIQSRTNEPNEPFVSAFDKYNNVSAGAGPFSSSPDLFNKRQEPLSSGKGDGLLSGNNGGKETFGDFQGGSSTAAESSSDGNADPFAASMNVPIDLFSDLSNLGKPSVIYSDDPFNFSENAGTAAISNRDSTYADAFAAQESDGSGIFSSFQSAHGYSSQTKPNGFEADPFEVLTEASASRNISAESKLSDPLEKLWSSTASKTAAPQTFSMPDDWGLETDFGRDEGGTTTELEGLPPPPSGVTAGMAKDRGLENHKQGQFADAIKWLSWAVDLLESSGDCTLLIQVLSCRASCFKEVGEYKKAVADCSKVLQKDDSNSAALLQRALLYESMEKYKLGVADLREVLKMEPSNRVASNTLSRLVKMVDQ